MRELRKAHNPPLTLKELAHKAGISYTTVWNLENGREEKVHSKFKNKVAQVLGVHAKDIFPSESVNWERVLSEVIRLFGEKAAARVSGKPIQYHHRFDTLEDLCPGVNFESELDVNEILRQMTRDELGKLYHFCVTPEEAIKQLNQAAKRLGLRPVRLMGTYTARKDNKGIN